MTDYAGETYEIAVTSADFDGVAIGPTDVDSVTIEIFDSGLDIVVADTPMTWVTADEEWVYTWHTLVLDPGSYLGKIWVRGPGSTVSFDTKRFRLARSPV